MTGSDLLDQARRLHPHAKRGLLIDWGDWGDRPTGEAIFAAIAHGRIDHYVLRPSAPPDELFHQAISNLLLEWAEARRELPVHGPRRRRVLVRAAPTSCGRFSGAARSRTRSCSGRLGRRPRPGRRRGPGGPSLPLVVFPNGTDPAEPEQRRDRARQPARPVDPGADGFRPRDRRRRAGRALGGRLRRVGRVQHAGHRRGRHRRSGDVELADPQLPRLPSRRQRPSAGSAGVRAGLGLRRATSPSCRRSTELRARGRTVLSVILSDFGRVQRPRGAAGDRRHYRRLGVAGARGV